MVKIHYFAWLRERLGINEESIELPSGVTNVSEFLNWLATRGEEFASVMESQEILQVAIDQQHTQDRKADITTAREIAIFPPMTGG